MKALWIILVIALLLLSGCALKAQTEPAPEPGGWQQIDQIAAAQKMAEDDGHLLVDVRRLDEFESGHIPGAICIPNEEIGGNMPEELPSLDQTILIYCRSGNRSKQAADKLAALGYTNLYEFGGIVDWTGEVVSGQALLLRVEANPTTGYSWTAEQEQELFALSSYYVTERRAEPVSGAGGWQCFVLTPERPGTARLTFRYARPWEEPGETDPCFSLVIEIGEDLSLNVIEDGAAEGEECGYVPRLWLY